MAPINIKPVYWKRYVDDVLAIIPTDMLITLNDNGTVTTSVYRKPTHTDQYLHSNSHHPLEHKLGLINTLVDRAEKVVRDMDLRKVEMDNIKKALHNCQYPEWSFQRVMENRKRKKNKGHEPQKLKIKMRGSIGIPYVKGMAERIRRTLSYHNVGTYFLPQNKIKNSLVHPKDKIEKMDTCGVIYEVTCRNCPQVYIGDRETGTQGGHYKHELMITKKMLQQTRESND
ncbi:uncharacterized protein [Antedon mediterranea]|uniref:uncharacterized protein n=1 Tax=Antedon mediterranea TaxID=105859 RepID=UPI003AF5B618